MRSSFIDWLIEQQEADGKAGILSRWVLSEIEFEPLEFHDILERIINDPHGTVDDKAEMKAIAVYCLVDYASFLAEEGIGIKIIEDAEIDKERLNIALKNENYEEAAKLRDRLNKLKDGNKEE